MSQSPSGVVVDKTDLSALSDLAAELRERLWCLERGAQPVPAEPMVEPPRVAVVEPEPAATVVVERDFVPAFQAEPQQPAPEPRPRAARPVVNWEMFAAAACSTRPARSCWSSG